MADADSPRLPNRVRYLTKGCDHKITLRRTERGEGDDSSQWPDLDWPDDAEIYVLIDVKRAEPTRVDGVIDGALVTMRIESEIADKCKDGTTWRVVISRGDPSYEQPLRLGYFERNDGE